MNDDNNLPVEIDQDEMQIVPVGESGLQIKSVEELDEGRKKRKAIANSMLKGKYGEGAEVGSVPGIQKMVFKEGTQYIKDAFNLGVGQAKTQIEKPTVTLQDGQIIQHYTFTSDVPIINLITGQIIAVGRASCSSLEERYRYRGEDRTCPTCKVPAIRKGLDRYGGGWYCNTKKNGCGKKFKDENKFISDQVVGRVENESPADVRDTCLSMSIKRATTREVLNVTGMSIYLTSGYEDNGKKHHEDGDAEKLKKKKDAEKFEKDPKKKEEGKTGKTLGEAKKAFYDEVLTALGDDEAIKNWLLEVQKETDPDGEFPVKTAISQFTTVNQLNMFKGLFRKEFEPPAKTEK